MYCKQCPEATFPFVSSYSNDLGLLKVNPLTVHIFSVEGISTQLLDMCMTRGCTAEDIFGKMDETLLNKCVSVGVDNTSVNLGKRKSIMTKALMADPVTLCITLHCMQCR